MTTKKQKVEAFVKSLLISLAVLTPLLTATYFVAGLLGRPSEPVAIAVTEPKAAKQLSLLLCVRDDGGYRAAAAVTFSPAEKNAVVTAVPISRLVEANAEKISVQGLRDRLAKELDISFYGFFCVSPLGLQRAVDAAGPFTFEVPCDMSVYETNGILIYEMSRGATRMDGLTVAGLVQYAPSFGEQIYEQVCAGLVQAALVEYSKSSNTDWLPDACLAAYEFAQTNLNTEKTSTAAETARAALDGGRVVRGVWPVSP